MGTEPLTLMVNHPQTAELMIVTALHIRRPEV
jgi:hypothetical protein